MNNLPQIPWENFSEEEIHFIIQRACERNGWKVYNLHKIQRNVEHGADLIVTKDDGKKIAIAVKIKPRSQDRIQLNDLFERDEEEKIYIYIKDPTPDFKNAMSKYNSRIRFLSKKEFSNWMFKLDPYLYSSLIIDLHEFSLKLAELQKFLIKLFYESTEGIIKPAKTKLNEESLRILWRLKDEVVFLNKSLRSFQIMFENIEDKPSEPEKDSVFLEGFIKVLNSFLDSIIFIHEKLKKMYEKNKNFVAYVIKKTEDRSNWKGILSFKLFIPGEIETEEDEEEDLKFLKNLSKVLGKPLEEFLKDEKRYNIPHSIAESCRILANFMGCVEAFVDDLFSYGIFDEYHTYVLYRDETSKDLEDSPSSWWI